jgi:regulator of cell morphogenesis and NO signaling
MRGGTALARSKDMNAVFPPSQTSPVDPTRTVADLAASLTGAVPIFESLGIDFCCRGSQSLREAVAQTSLSLEAVLEQLGSAAASDLRAAAMPAPVPSQPALLAAHIASTHHVFTRGELQRLAPLAAKVLRVHGPTRPELARVSELLLALEQDLLPHMAKEEQVLFPYISRLAAGDHSRPAFGKIDNPLHVMHVEHERVGDLLRELERVTDGYRPPAQACSSYSALYAGLKGLQEDLHQHIHLENNVLFPGARTLEQRVLRSA